MEVDITDEVLPGSPKNDQHQVVPEPPYLMNGDEGFYALLPSLKYLGIHNVSF